MKKVRSRCLNFFFGLTFNKMESYHPEHKLVYYKFLKKVISWARQRDETVFKLCHFYCLSICLILTVFRFVGANLHFRFHNLSVFDILFNLKSYAKYLSDIKLNVSFS